MFLYISVTKLICMDHFNSLTELYSYVWCRFESWKKSLQPLPTLKLIPTKRSWRWPWNSAFSACMATPVRRARPATLKTTHLRRSLIQMLLQVSGHVF